MPAWLRVVAHANPLTYEVQGLRQMLVGVGGAGVLWLGFAVVAGFFAAILGCRHARLSEGDPVDGPVRGRRRIRGAPPPSLDLEEEQQMTTQVQVAPSPDGVPGAVTDPRR